MAESIIEKCIRQVSNRFKLALLASQRTHDLNTGASSSIQADEFKGHKNTIISLYEIAERQVNIHELFNLLFYSPFKTLNYEWYSNVRIQLTYCTYVPNYECTDVAITEASVGAGLSTVFTFAALSLIKNHKTNLSHSPIMLFFMSFLAICLSYFMTQLPDFGSHDAPIHLHVAPYYIENTEKITGVPNIVTAILASLRGYDTFGETIVVFTAALCIILTLKEEKE
ncbi:unnamed protein product [Ceratitis capitata]|uniref:DNA-directed RNA polymerase n=1 Tax=Ceratitis capitata TaxID=7213 RepID=A0A811UQY3_CERCA|nr:unnamed protein product [Ceratitis capitata]